MRADTRITQIDHASRSPNPAGFWLTIERKIEWRTGGLGLLWLVLIFFVAGCGGNESPTRTPVPTWTPTPVGNPAANSAPSDQVQAQVAPQESEPVAAPTLPPAQQALPLAATATLVSQALPTSTPLPQPTFTSTALPTETPTETVQPTDFEFELEAAEKFPTDSLAENVVRVFLYVYGDGQYALPGYSIAVNHDEAQLDVEATSSGGLPDLTREQPGPYTRFTNMTAIFIEPQGGRWQIQLVDDQGTIVGEPAIIDLDPEGDARELYVRYKLR